MARIELITSEEYLAATLECELWNMAGQPKFGMGKYETKGKKLAKKIHPIIKEIIEHFESQQSDIYYR